MTPDLSTGQRVLELPFNESSLTYAGSSSGRVGCVNPAAAKAEERPSPLASATISSNGTLPKFKTLKSAP